MKIRTEQVIDVSDWDDLVEKTYGRTYSFQQQDGCRERGNFYLRVPVECGWEYTNDTVLEKVNGDEMGVSFAAWLARDPEQMLNNSGDEYDRGEFGRELWWERNFYPEVQMVANDLHAKGLLPAGDYTINIDW